MALRYRKLEDSERIREKELKDFGKAFFALFGDAMEKEGIWKSLLGFRAVVEAAAKLYGERKAALCSNPAAIDLKGCRALMEIVEADSFRPGLESCFEIMEKGGEDRGFLMCFFYYLENFMKPNGDEENLRRLSGCFGDLSSELESMKEVSRLDMLTERKWEVEHSGEDILPPEVRETPLGILGFDEKLKLLCRLKLIERFVRCFKENGEEGNMADFSFCCDNRAQYFVDVF